MRPSRIACELHNVQPSCLYPPNRSRGILEADAGKWSVGLAAISGKEKMIQRTRDDFVNLYVGLMFGFVICFALLELVGVRAGRDVIFMLLIGNGLVHVVILVARYALKRKEL